jgi:hypothetical protein
MFDKFMYCRHGFSCCDIAAAIIHISDAVMFHVVAFYLVFVFYR